MRQRKSPWIYMVYNWYMPVACYTNAVAEEDVTETILRVADKVRKEAVAAK